MVPVLLLLKILFHSFIYTVLCAMSLLVTVTIFPVFNGYQTLDRLDDCLVFNATISSPPISILARIDLPTLQAPAK
jgi:hypothetical protein